MQNYTPDIPFDMHTVTLFTPDSRNVIKGAVFLAVRGEKDDGTRYISSAVKNGASVIITHSDVDTSDVPDSVCILKSDNPRKEYALLVSEYYNKKPSYIATVTGTNGKTSIASFVQQIWELMGKNAISVGTMGISGCGYKPSSSLTTPEPNDLHKTLQSAVIEKSVSHACIESSSHGLHMNRLNGIDFKVAGFTNLSRDHLDYHNTMQEYLEAKSYLFSTLLNPTGTAVLNCTIPEFDTLQSICQKRNIKTITYGMTEKCNPSQQPDISVIGYKRLPHGFDVDIEAFNTVISTHIPLVGIFQLENILCAIAMVCADGTDIQDIITILPRIKGAIGRMQYMGKTPKGGDVYIDFAHSPDALETVLKTMRPHTQNQMYVVVGCGGDRDTGKRPIMGGIAETFADKAIITDDNPRTENPESIRQQMLVNAPNAIEIGDRTKAISHTLQSMDTGDVAIIAGKGHEQGQIIGTETLPYCDIETVRLTLDTMFTEYSKTKNIAKDDMI